MRKLILMVIIFLLEVKCMLRYEAKRHAESSKLLKNNFAFAGIITDIKISRNHNFGIVFLQLKSAPALKLSKSYPFKIKFPYLIVGNKAEVYTIISDGVKLGDSVRVESNEERVYYYDKSGKQKSLGSIYTIDDPSDLEFIHGNSDFK